MLPPERVHPELLEGVSSVRLDEIDRPVVLHRQALVSSVIEQELDHPHLEFKRDSNRPFLQASYIDEVGHADQGLAEST